MSDLGLRVFAVGLKKGFGAIGAALFVIYGADIGGAVWAVGLAAIGTRPAGGFEFGAKIEHDRLVPPQTPEMIVSLAPIARLALTIAAVVGGIGAHGVGVGCKPVAVLNLILDERARNFAGVPGAARRFFADEGVRDFRPDGTAIGIGVVRVGAADKPASIFVVLPDGGGPAAERATIERLGAGFAAHVFRHVHRSGLNMLMWAVSVGWFLRSAARAASRWLALVSCRVRVTQRGQIAVVWFHSLRHV